MDIDINKYKGNIIHEVDSKFENDWFLIIL